MPLSETAVTRCSFFRDPALLIRSAQPSSDLRDGNLKLSAAQITAATGGAAMTPARCFTWFQRGVMGLGSLLVVLAVSTPVEAKRQQGARADVAHARQRLATPAARVRAVGQLPDERRGRTSSRTPHTAPRPLTRSAGRDAAVAALARAERVTNVDPAVLRAIAGRESQFNPTAKNPLSSARGLMQFTRSTWLEVVRDFGGRHGLGGYAAALRTDREGNITARDPRVLARILRMRDDPQLAAVMASERIGQQQAALERELGRPVTPTDLYLVHMLGPQGARRFLTELRRNPAASSVAVVGPAARPNPGVFERRGRSLPLSQVYQEVAELMQPSGKPGSRAGEGKQDEAPPTVSVLASTAP